MKAEILSPLTIETRYSQGSTENPTPIGMEFRLPLVQVEYQDQGLISRISTGRVGINIPEPNLLLCIVEADVSVIDQIAQDSTYFILWREDIANDGAEVDSQTFGLLRAYLAQNGATQAQINEAVTETASSFNNRAQLVTNIRAWLQTLLVRP